MSSTALGLTLLPAGGCFALAARNVLAVVFVVGDGVARLFVWATASRSLFLPVSNDVDFLAVAASVVDFVVFR